MTKLADTLSALQQQHKEMLETTNSIKSRTTPTSIESTKLISQIQTKLSDVMKHMEERCAQDEKNLRVVEERWKSKLDQINTLTSQIQNKIEPKAQSAPTTSQTQIHMPPSHNTTSSNLDIVVNIGVIVFLGGIAFGHYYRWMKSKAR